MTETFLAKKSAPPQNSLCASRSISFALLLAFALGLMMPAMLRARGVTFERFEMPGFDVAGDTIAAPDNYPSKGTGERERKATHRRHFRARRAGRKAACASKPREADAPAGRKGNNAGPALSLGAP